MKNKVILKKYLFLSFIVCFIIILLFTIILLKQYKNYTTSYNKKIEQIVSYVKEKYPDIKDEDIVDILDSKSSNETTLFKKYGLDIEESSVLLENKNKYYKYIVEDLLIIISSLTIVYLIFMKYLKKRDNDLKEITKSIEQINRKNYELQLDSNSEDELSILKNEIYKTTIMLKEAAENFITIKFYINIF